jgi:hypothetical protein
MNEGETNYQILWTNTEKLVGRPCQSATWLIAALPFTSSLSAQWHQDS